MVNTQILYKTSDKTSDKTKLNDYTLRNVRQQARKEQGGDALAGGPQPGWSLE